MTVPLGPPMTVRATGPRPDEGVAKGPPASLAACQDFATPTRARPAVAQARPAARLVQIRGSATSSAAETTCDNPQKTTRPSDARRAWPIAFSIRPPKRLWTTWSPQPHPCRQRLGSESPFCCATTGHTAAPMPEHADRQFVTPVGFCCLDVPAHKDKTTGERPTRKHGSSSCSSRRQHPFRDCTHRLGS